MHGVMRDTCYKNDSDFLKLNNILFNMDIMSEVTNINHMINYLKFVYVIHNIFKCYIISSNPIKMYQGSNMIKSNKNLNSELLGKIYN